MKMPRIAYQFEVGQKVIVEGGDPHPARVLRVKRGQLEIRDAYGWVRTVNKRDCRPHS